MSRCLTAVLALASTLPALAAAPRGRDLGIPFDFGDPGPVERDHRRARRRGRARDPDRGRRGAHRGDRVLPRGKGDAARSPCFGGAYSLNGNGEMTGLPWLEESGLLDGPVAITNTNAVGVVRDALIQYAARRWPPKGDADGRSGPCPSWPRPGTAT